MNDRDLGGADSAKQKAAVAALATAMRKPDQKAPEQRREDKRVDMALLTTEQRALIREQERQRTRVEWTPDKGTRYQSRFYVDARKKDPSMDYRFMRWIGTDGRIDHANAENKLRSGWQIVNRDTVTNGAHFDDVDFDDATGAIVRYQQVLCQRPMAETIARRKQMAEYERSKIKRQLEPSENFKEFERDVRRKGRSIPLPPSMEKEILEAPERAVAMERETSLAEVS